MDWAEKYRPATLKEVVGNPKAVKELRQWAKEWEAGRPGKKGVILSYYRANLLHKIQRVIRRTIKKTPTRIKMLPKRTFQEELKKAGWEAVCEIPLFRGIHSQQVVLLKKAKTRV